jgi:hypothetical protein
MKPIGSRSAPRLGTLVAVITWTGAGAARAEGIEDPAALFLEIAAFSVDASSSDAAVSVDDLAREAAQKAEARCGPLGDIPVLVSHTVHSRATLVGQVVTYDGMFRCIDDLGQ